jgi:hypothetical protein
MFHNMLVDQDIRFLTLITEVVMDTDFRTGIYRFMGGKDLSDHLMVKILSRKSWYRCFKSGYLWRFLWWFYYLNGMLTGPKECIWCST